VLSSLQQDSEQEKGMGHYKFVNYIDSDSQMERRVCAEVTGLRPSVRHSRKQKASAQAGMGLAGS
jgi:hypothetical protein